MRRDEKTRVREEGSGGGVRRLREVQSLTRGHTARRRQSQDSSLHLGDFPGGPGVKSLPANAGNTGSIPGLGGMPQSS